MKDKYYKLEQFRHEYGYKTDDMARFLNISKIYYWQLENKKRRLSYKNAVLISKIFKTKPDELFYEDTLREI